VFFGSGSVYVCVWMGGEGGHDTGGGEVRACVRTCEGWGACFGSLFVVVLYV
jgi:hypothetical protein